MTIPRKRRLLIAALLVLLAAVIRMYGLAEIPPGLHYDEAANGQFVRDIAFHGYRPLFIAAYTGKETLWFYLAGVLMRLIGPPAFGGIFPLRLTSALIGTVTVVLTGWLVSRLYAGDDRRDWLVLLSMAVLATAFWHGVLSRLAFRAITQPLLQALSIGLLWVGLRAPRSKRKWVTVGLAGAATGLAAYTYLAARLFPIPLAVTVLILFICDENRMKRIPALLLYGGAALLVVLPLLVYFFTHPETFGARIGQVAPATPAEALAGWKAALKMLFISGDPLWRFNVPGKPLFGPPLGALFVVGYGAVVWEAFRTDEALERARGALLMVWPLAMLAPTALATNSIVPSNLRAVGLVPLIALYPALGIMTAGSWLARWRVAWRPAALSGGLALIAAAGGFSTLWTTVRWGDSPALYNENDGPVVSLADYLNAQQADGTTAYMATAHPNHPTLGFLSTDYALERSLFRGNVLVLAAEGDTLATYTRNVLPPAEWEDLIGEWRVSAFSGPDGSPDFAAYRIPAGAALDVPASEPVNFGNVIRLEGAWTHEAISGETASVDLLWEVLARPAAPDYSFVGTVCDQWDHCWLRVGEEGQVQHGVNIGYPSGRWKPGERLLTRIEMPLPEGIPPGMYEVRVRVASNSAPALPVLDEAGGFAGIATVVGPLTVKPNPTAIVDEAQVSQRINKQAGYGVVLLGYELPPATLLPGERLNLTLTWQALTEPGEDKPVQLKLGDRVLYEGDPVHGSYPLSDWEAGELVGDHISERVPQDTPAGTYPLTVQLGDGPAIRLTTLAVEEADRTFEVPGELAEIEPPPELGGRASLVAFSMPEGPYAPGDVLPVTVAWRAEQEMDTSYMVFVHLFGGDGQNLTQSDRLPQKDDEPYPTDLWLPGEVVVDTYLLAIPEDAQPGTYRLRVGLYLQESGTRLAIPDVEDNAFILPLDVTIQ